MEAKIVYWELYWNTGLGALYGGSIQVRERKYKYLGVIPGISMT